MSNYRPKDWKNPYENHGAVLKEMGNEIAFEVGADAMLEKLKDNGTFTYGHHSPDIDDQEISGYWVFIPNEE